MEKGIINNFTQKMANGNDIERVENGNDNGDDIKCVEDGKNGNGSVNTTTPIADTEASPGLGELGRSSAIRLAANQVRERNAPGLFAVICGSICCCSFLIGIIFLVFLKILCITSIIIGAIYLNRCPIEPNIPIMLICLGVIGVVLCISGTIENCRKEGQEDVKPPSGVICFNSVLKLAQLILIHYTAAIIYRSYSDVQYYGEIDGDKYCDPVAYKFAFWLITLNLIILSIGSLVFCICCCAVVIAGSRN